MDAKNTSFQQLSPRPATAAETRAREICQAAWESLDLPNGKESLIRFTAGVLKLPWEYWEDVVQALQEGRWRDTDLPLQYVRKVAARIAKKRKDEEARGSYVGVGRHPITEIRCELCGKHFETERKYDQHSSRCIEDIITSN